MTLQNSIGVPATVEIGGTGVTSVTTTPTATSFAGWDSNSSLSAGSFIQGYTTTATAAGTTTLTVGSTGIQVFTGATTQTVTLPVASTMVLGQRFEIINRSSGIVTVQSSGANTIQTMASSTLLIVTCILTSGTGTASWNSIYTSNTLTGSIDTLTADGAVIVSPDGVFNVDILGTANQVETAGTASTITMSTPATFIAPGTMQSTTTTEVGAGNLIMTDGNVAFQTNTNAALTAGVITFPDGSRIHNYGTGNIFMGGSAGNGTLTGSENTCIGLNSGSALTTGIENTAIGAYSLRNLSSGSYNVAMGRFTLESVTTASRNAAVGSNALQLCNGTANTAIGNQALQTATSPSYNTAIGYLAGLNYLTTESNNICIGSGVSGTVTESGVTRIGSSQVQCYIDGIRGRTTVNADAVAVLIDSAGQLGTVSSSIRFKENVLDMGSESSSIMDLRPVKFNFKDDGRVGYGLIAEEVSAIFPYLCATQPQTKETEDGPVIDEEKEPIAFSVKYQELPVLLLNEIQKLSKRIEELEKLVK